MIRYLEHVTCSNSYLIVHRMAGTGRKQLVNTCNSVFYYTPQTATYLTQGRIAGKHLYMPGPASHSSRLGPSPTHTPFLSRCVAWLSRGRHGKGGGRQTTHSGKVWLLPAYLQAYKMGYHEEQPAASVPGRLISSQPLLTSYNASPSPLLPEGPSS